MTIEPRRTTNLATLYDEEAMSACGRRAALGILLAENGDAAEEAGVDVDRLRSASARHQAGSAAFGEQLAHRFADQVLLARPSRSPTP